MFTGIEKLEYKKAEKTKGTARENEFNLLNIPLIKKLLLWKAFPYSVQTLILLVLLGFIMLGWGVYTPEGQDEELFAKTNIVCLVIWGIWWPLMIWTVVVLGRIWCMVCPLELMNRIGGKIGRVLKIKKLSISGPIRSGFVIVSLYALIQLLVSGTGLHYVPAYTALFLSCLIAFALITGLVFSAGSFCKGFCPIAMTLNAYSRGGMLAVRAGSVDKCEECKEKSCIRRKENKGALNQEGGCPANLYPPHLTSNKDCMLCAQCIKACEPGNMQLLLRHPFSKKDRREKRASWALTIFVMIDSGFVLGEICEQWALTDKLFMTVPQYIMNYFSWQDYSGWGEGIWTLFIFPLVLWAFSGIALKSIGAVKSIMHWWRSFAFRAVIIFSSLHLIKSLLRFTEWSAFLPYALKHAGGINKARAINSGILTSPQSIFNQYAVLVISSGILCFALYFFIREKHLGNS